MSIAFAIFGGFMAAIAVGGALAGDPGLAVAFALLAALALFVAIEAWPRR